MGEEVACVGGQNPCGVEGIQWETFHHRAEGGVTHGERPGSGCWGLWGGRGWSGAGWKVGVGQCSVQGAGTGQVLAVMVAILSWSHTGNGPVSKHHEGHGHRLLIVRENATNSLQWGAR